MSDEPKVKSTKVILTREKFDAIPGFRARYIFTYILIFVVWAVATATGFYYDAVEVPVEPGMSFGIPEEAPPADTAAETAEPSEPEMRTEYRWRWTPGVRVFQDTMMFGMVFFYIYFTRVMALMGYPLPMILGYCAAVFLPIPGILAVAFVDRQIAKTWNVADDRFREQDDYQERVAATTKQ